MNTLRIAIAIAWAVFWLYWLLSAFGAKHGSRERRRRVPLAGATVIALVLLLRIFRSSGLVVHSLFLGGIGAALFAAGLALAISARLHLGSNWGMPMTQKAEPELITTGPYRVVRNPIYSGLLLALLGTALATNLIGLVIVALLGGSFYYAALVEERNLAASFPATYPVYRAHTKLLIPFVL